MFNRIWGNRIYVKYILYILISIFVNLTLIKYGFIAYMLYRKGVFYK